MNAAGYGFRVRALSARPGMTLSRLLRLDLGGLDQLAAHGDPAADGFGKLRRRPRHNGETDRGETLLHGVDPEHLDELVVQPRDDRRRRPGRREEAEPRRHLEARNGLADRRHVRQAGVAGLLDHARES